MKLKFLYVFFVFVLLLLACKEEEAFEPAITVQGDFELTQDFIYNGDTIHFIDKSTGNPTTWNWTFEGGIPATSTEQNPSVRYDESGSYIASLKVSNGQTESSRSFLVTVTDIKEPPYGGTIFIESDIVRDEDPSSYQSVTFVVQEMRTMYDRRVEDWVNVDANVFKASYEGGDTFEIQINTEIPMTLARQYAEAYGKAVGQIPRFLLNELKTVSIMDGEKLFGGGNNDLLVHIKQGEIYINSGILVETLIHEAGHVSLQYLHGDSEYLEYRRKDPTYISTFARDNINSEDVSETILLYLAYRYRPDRLTELDKYKISKIIHHRMEFFDTQDYDIYPWTK